MTGDQRWEDYIPDPRRWQVLWVLVVVLFMSLMSVSSINVALPTIELGLHATQSELQWVLSGYALTFGIGLVAAGRAGDIYGRAPLFIAGVAVFTLSSVWAGLAPDPLQLNLARAVMGVGSGLAGPQAVGMIQQYFRGAERGRAFGIFGSVVGVSVSIGPLLGGVLIEAGGTQTGWRWTFFVNLPIGILAIVLAALWIPRPLLNSHREPEPGQIPPSRDLDPIGSVLLGLAVLAVMVPFLESGASPFVWFALPAGVGILLVWIWWENRYKDSGREPMVDMQIFRVTSFANGTLLVSLYFLGVTSVWILVALYMQDGLHHTALESGLVGLPSSILSAIAALWAGRSVAKLGRKVVIGGLYCALVGLVLSILVVWLHSIGAASEWWLLLSLSFVGIAQGAVISPNQALTLAEVPLPYAGSSGGVMQTGQRIGTSVGIAVITALSFGVLAVSNWSVAFNAGFAVIIIVVAIALVVAYRDLRQRHGNAWL
ncbi:MFS transporter [Microbacterium terrisoli]|uniref:MFS transporter n=1 Tax=Microbacterium terrisoli TaxID=3242192 RepID=UPI00280555CF|nr:MFS transporter [Microbacterium protaetiae]